MTIGQSGWQAGWVIMDADGSPPKKKGTHPNFKNLNTHMQ